MSTNSECERLRMQQMARLDGEEKAVSDLDRTHLATCASCQQWLAEFASLTPRFESLSYPESPTDLWSSIEGRIGHADPIPFVTGRLWLIGGLVVFVRAVQLLVDVPMPTLQLLGPLVAAVAIAAVWKMVGGALSIETWAPEFGKGDF